MLIVIITFLVLLAIGMPVAFAIGIAGVLFFIITPFVPYSIAVQKVVAATQSLNMLAIPLFIFAGNLMNETGITKRLIHLSDTLVGHLPGHLGQISCVLSTLMGGVSGSANADAAMECRVLGPDMIKSGYSRNRSRHPDVRRFDDRSPSVSEEEGVPACKRDETDIEGSRKGTG